MTNFPRKLLLTDTQVSSLRKTFPNGSSANTKFSKTQQLGGSLIGSLHLKLENVLPYKLVDSLIKSFGKEATKKAFLNQGKTSKESFYKCRS